MTTATHCTDELAHLAGILANPDEDTPRLMYADWLQENAEPVRAECPACKDAEPDECEPHPADIPCPACSGTGTVTRPCSRAARAELLRIQCRAASLERDGHGDNCPAYAKMRKRAQLASGGQMLPKCVKCEDLYHLHYQAEEIIGRYSDAWRAGPKCKECGGKGYTGSEQHSTECFACHGTGDLGGLLRKFRYYDASPHNTEPARVSYSRGMKVVTVPALSDVCEMYDSEGVVSGWEKYQPTDWLAAVVLHHPDCEAVVCLDREPYHNGGLSGWAWFDDTRTHKVGTVPTAAELPTAVFACLTGFASSRGGGGTRWRPYDTADTARLALGRALVRWARGHAAKQPQ